MRFIALAAFCFWSAVCAPAAAGPPYQTDDPEPTAYRHFEIYVFGTYGNAAGEGVSGNLPSIEINYGLMPNVQFSVTAPFAAGQEPASPLRTGYGDTEVALKVRFLQEGAGRPQVSFYPAVELPTSAVSPGLGSGGLPKFFFPLWAQKTNGSWTYFGGGGVWHNPGAGNRDYAFTGIAATHQVRDGVSIGARAVSSDRRHDRRPRLDCDRHRLHRGARRAPRVAGIVRPRHLRAEHVHRLRGVRAVSGSEGQPRGTVTFRAAALPSGTAGACATAGETARYSREAIGWGARMLADRHEGILRRTHRGRSRGEGRSRGNPAAATRHFRNGG